MRGQSPADGHRPGKAMVPRQVARRRAVLLYININISTYVPVSAFSVPPPCPSRPDTGTGANLSDRVGHVKRSAGVG